MVLWVSHNFSKFVKLESELILLIALFQRCKCVRLLKLESELMLLIALPPRFNRSRPVNPDSELTSLIALFFSHNRSRFLKLEIGLRLLMRLSLRSRLIRFVAAANPVRSVIALSCANKCVNRSITVSMSGKSRGNPNVDRTAAAKCASGTFTLVRPEACSITKSRSALSTLSLLLTSVRRFWMSQTYRPKASITRSTSVAFTLPSVFTSHGGYCVI